MTKWDLSQGCKSISTFVIHHINKLKKKKNHIIVSIGSGKAHDKIQHPFMIKTLKKPLVEGNFLNFLNNIYKTLQLTS